MNTEDMKIGLVVAHFPPEINAGAVRVGPFVEAWAEEGGNVDVITHRKERQVADRFAEQPRVQLHRVALGIEDNTRSLPVRLLNEFALCFLLFWKSLPRKVDVYVTSSPPFLVAATTSLISLISRTPFVLDVRDLHPEQLFSYNIVQRDSLLGRFLTWLESKIYNRASLVIAVTEGMVGFIRARTNTKTIRVPNGIDARKFYREKSQSPPDPFVVLFHGILARSQNVELILRLAKHLRRRGVHDVILRVIGYGPKEKILTAEIDENSLGDIVDFIGHVDFEDIPAHVNRADVGFSPRLDGLVNKTVIPVKVYECLGCGLPVIVTPLGEAGDFVEENQVGFQHSNEDVEGIYESIMMLKEDKQLYKEYSNRAVDLAASFDRRELGRKLYYHIEESVLQLNEKHPSPPA